jgi:hypothetical protein
MHQSDKLNNNDPGASYSSTIANRYGHLFNGSDSQKDLSDFVKNHPEEANTLFHILASRPEGKRAAKTLGNAFVSGWVSKQKGYHHTAYFVSEELVKMGARAEPIERKAVMSEAEQMIEAQGYVAKPVLKSYNLEQVQPE